MSTILNGRAVAVLAADGVEQSEILVPKQRLEDAGATVHVIGPRPGSIRAWEQSDWARAVPVDREIGECDADDYDALVLPGGVMNADRLRTREDATRFVRGFFKAGKPVAAICHGPQILIDCGVIEGRELTSHPAIKNDLKNAGARWTDQPVVCDQGLVTSRTADDLPAFVDKTIEEIAEGVHSGQMTA